MKPNLVFYRQNVDSICNWMVWKQSAKCGPEFQSNHMLAKRFSESLAAMSQHLWPHSCDLRWIVWFRCKNWSDSDLTWISVVSVKASLFTLKAHLRRKHCKYGTIIIANECLWMCLTINYWSSNLKTFLKCISSTDKLNKIIPISLFRFRVRLNLPVRFLLYNIAIIVQHRSQYSDIIYGRLLPFKWFTSRFQYFTQLEIPKALTFTSD